MNNPSQQIDHGGHRARVRQSVLSDPSLETLTDEQVLALMLFYVLPRVDTRPIALALISRFGDLRGVLEASTEELMQVRGIGESAALFLSVMPAFCRRYLMSRAASDVSLKDTDALGRALLPMFIGKPRETLYALFLDRELRTIECKLLSEGTADSVTMESEALCLAATQCGAVYAVLAHNHPSGFAAPSEADLIATDRAYAALAGVGVILRDHLIISDPLADSSQPYELVSLADSGFFHCKNRL